MAFEIPPAHLNWPDDADYMNRCAECERMFFGPKRAPLCWEHWVTPEPEEEQ